MNLASKPYSESCQQNQDVILAELRRYLQPGDRVFEIASGTGQHAVHFCTQLGDIHWQTSDCAPQLPGIRAWLEEAGLDRLPAPLTLDVRHDRWPRAEYQLVFSANSVHIMSWPAVQAMFQGIGKLLPAGGLFLLYGPFSYGGRHTSPSNARFQQWLQQRDPHSGVRDLDQLRPLADDNGLQLSEDIEMPVNNRILVWRKTAATISG